MSKQHLIKPGVIYSLSDTADAIVASRNYHPSMLTILADTRAVTRVPVELGTEPLADFDRHVEQAQAHLLAPVVSITSGRVIV